MESFYDFEIAYQGQEPAARTAPVPGRPGAAGGMGGGAGKFWRARSASELPRLELPHTAALRFMEEGRGISIFE